jgi:serine/threonine protein kinase/tetratricopeptide (TPR) repeat protein
MNLDAERFKRVETLYHAALEQHIDARASFLSEACAGDDALRREVESLLAHATPGDSFLESGPGAVITTGRRRLRAGDQAGPYTIVAFIGSGGMGQVYRARDPRLQRDVAIKVLAPAAASPALERRLLAEAQAASALNHPNILAIYDIGSQIPAPGGAAITYIVMELLEGQTLRERLNACVRDASASRHADRAEDGEAAPAAALTVEETVDIAVQIAAGLAAAHDKGIVHRDLKPENLFLTTGGRVKIVDFGLARQVLGDAAPMTNPGTVLGTAGYMAPEQVRGETADHRADLFAFGAILFEMVAGRPAFAAPSAAEAMSAVLRDEPALPSSARGSARERAPGLERIVIRCLRKRAAERFQSAGDLVAELANLKNEARTSSAAPSAKRVKRYAVAGSLAAVAILFVVLAITYATRRGKAIDSVAILPFVNVGSTPDTEWLSDGITESLIRDLSQVTRLDVKAREAAFRYKGREIDPQLAGRELRVQAVLTGRVVRRGDALTIDVELMDVRDNRRLWGDRYDYKLRDLLQAQADISREVADKLKLRLSGAEEQRLARRSTTSAEAHEFYLKGRFHWSQQTGDGLKQAIAYFHQALKHDPNYALPYIGLADSYIVLGEDLMPPKEAMPQAKAYALEALRLDETIAEAHAALGIVKLLYEWDWLAAERELGPNLNAGQTVETFSCALHYSDPLGRNEEGIAGIRRALERDPLSLLASQELGCASYYGRHYDQAIRQFTELSTVHPDYAWAHYGAGRAYAQKGMHEEAIAELTRAMTLAPGWPPAMADLGYALAVSGRRADALKMIQQLTTEATHRYVDPYLVAMVYAGLGDTDQAFVWLERAYDDRSSFLPWLKIEPKWDRLHADRRFADLLRRVGLVS